MTAPRLALIAVAFAVYWFGFRGGCGTRGAIACPPPALEEGVGVTLAAAEVCPAAGYLCNGRDSFQVVRWPLTQGNIRVRIPLPELADPELAVQLREAAAEGIMAWDRHPFPIVIDNSKFTLRVADIVIGWSRELFNAKGGHAVVNALPDGKRMRYSINELMIALMPRGFGGTNVLAMLGVEKVDRETAIEWAARVKVTATHEMGHALGLLHSDRSDDVMFPEMARDSSLQFASERDFATIEALYKLPNGARVR
jgi:predicted Zn-dependent protease